MARGPYCGGSLHFPDSILGKWTELLAVVIDGRRGAGIDNLLDADVVTIIDADGNSKHSGIFKWTSRCHGKGEWVLGEFQVRGEERVVERKGVGVLVT